MGGYLWWMFSSTVPRVTMRTTRTWFTWRHHGEGMGDTRRRAWRHGGCSLEYGGLQPGCMGLQPL